jgi:hypothetical protein
MGATVFQAMVSVQLPAPGGERLRKGQKPEQHNRLALLVISQINKALTRQLALC